MPDVLRQMRALLRPLQMRIANLAARAVVQLVNDALKLQTVQLGVLAGEDIDDAEHFQAYGFSSVPLAGAEAVVLFPGGDRGHPLVVAVADRRHRPTDGQPGEVVMYSDEGDQIRLARGNVIALSTTGEVRLGSTGASDPVALRSDLLLLWDAILAGINGAVEGDGGAAALTALRTALGAGWPQCSAKVKAT
jgi:phage baseplate assembly protein V